MIFITRDSSFWRRVEFGEESGGGISIVAPPFGKFLTQADPSHITPGECRTKCQRRPQHRLSGLSRKDCLRRIAIYLHFAALEREVEDTLDVVSLREKIDEVRFLDAVSGLKQTSQITGEGSWITRNIGQSR